MSATRRKNLSGATTDWALSAAGTLYLGAALFGAVQLRQISGTVSRQWLTDLDSSLSIEWANAPRGLAWVITVILCTWLADTFAYMVGSKIGRHKLSPVVSPNKSKEGFGARHGRRRDHRRHLLLGLRPHSALAVGTSLRRHHRLGRSLW